MESWTAPRPGEPNWRGCSRRGEPSEYLLGEEDVIKEEKPNVGAEQVAAIRAAWSKRPENERVCYDPLARVFLGPELAGVIDDPKLTETVAAAVEESTPGAIGCVAARTRYIDDYLKTCIDGGIEELVILGAGYDTRPYRFSELKGKVRVFELDQPLTQKAKIEKLQMILGSIPEHVMYVPINFDKESIADRLHASGFATDLKTLFIWEGVTMYITAEAVDMTLGFVTRNSGKGSSIIFNYMFQSVVDGTCRTPDAEKMRQSYAERGEPLIFGIPEGTIDGFLSERGFCNVKEVNGDFFKSSYFKGELASTPVCRFCGFVTATVKHN
jgi:methyltransferase (TIGR00027 family)